MLIKLIKKNPIIALFFYLMIQACSSSAPEKSEMKTSKQEEQNSKTENNEKSESVRSMDEEMKSVVMSVSNSPLTGHRADKAAALNLSKSAGSELFVALSAKVVAQESFNSVYGTAKAYVKAKLKQNPSYRLNDKVKMLLALSALQNKRFGFLEMILNELSQSKNIVSNSFVYNLRGVIEVNNNNYPDAMDYFEKALKVRESNKAAQINMGALALHFADLNNAKRGLGSNSGNWFVDSELMIIDRHSGNSSMAKSKCDKLSSEKSSYMAILFNCGVLYFEDLKDYKTAKSFISKAASAKMGSSSWAQKAYGLIDKISIAESQAKMNKSTEPTKTNNKAKPETPKSN